MALSTYQWQPPDTSWVGQLVMAGARMRQAEEARQQAAMAQMRQEQARKEEADRRMAFEAETAARLGQQFNIQHAFKENQAKFDNARLTKRDTWEAEDRAPLPDPELPGSGPTVPTVPDAAAPPAPGALPEPPAAPGAAAVAAPVPVPDAPQPGDMMGPPIPPSMKLAGESTADRVSRMAEMPMTGPPIDLNAPSPLAPMPESPARALAGMAKTLHKYRVPSGEARKSISDAARTIAVQSAKPASASLGGQIRNLPNGDMVIGNSVYRTDPMTGQTVRVGVAPQAGGVLTDAEGNTVVPMRNGKFLVNGEVMDSPPGPLNKLPGATEVRRADLAEDKETRQADQGAQRLKQSAAAQQDRDIAKQKEDLFKSVEAARREADRAQTDLEQLRKNAVNSPRTGPDGKLMMGQRELDQAEYDRLLKKYNDYKTEEETLQKRITTNRVEASSAQRQLDAMQQGRKPNEEAKPAVPTAPPAAPAAATPPAAPAPAAGPAKTIWRKAPDGTLWEYDEATKKPTGKYVPGQ